jgi:hypothetical protein
MICNRHQFLFGVKSENNEMGGHVARMERDERHAGFTFAIIMLNAQQKEQMSVSVKKVPSVIQCCDVMLCAAVSIRSVV